MLRIALAGREVVFLATPIFYIYITVNVLNAMCVIVVNTKRDSCAPLSVLLDQTRHGESNGAIRFHVRRREVLLWVLRFVLIILI